LPYKSQAKVFPFEAKVASLLSVVRNVFSSNLFKILYILIYTKAIDTKSQFGCLFSPFWFELLVVRVKK